MEDTEEQTGRCGQEQVRCSGTEGQVDAAGFWTQTRKRFNMWTMWICWHTWRDVCRQMEQTYKLRHETLMQSDGDGSRSASWLQQHTEHKAETRSGFQMTFGDSSCVHVMDSLNPSSEIFPGAVLPAERCVLNPQATSCCRDWELWKRISEAMLAQLAGSQRSMMGKMQPRAIWLLAVVCVDSLTDWTCVRYVIHLFTSWGNTVIAPYWPGNTFWEKELY